ncbi:MAG: hypothetical protein EA398_01385 [Deltaproteobacteria bacterium]|nr:MAG: hypothetical protein EA398_01385 [Deltaproteobacteria bacterium]
MSSPSLRVALIEPLPRLADHFASTLRNHGHDIVPANDEPDVVLVSREGWDRDWREIVRREGAGDARLVLTAVAVQSDDEIPAGARSLLARPFSPSALQAAVLHAVGGDTVAMFGSVTTAAASAAHSIVLEETFAEEAARAENGVPDLAQEDASTGEGEPEEAVAAPASASAAASREEEAVDTEAVEGAGREIAPDGSSPVVSIDVDEAVLDELACAVAERIDEWVALPEGDMRERIVRAFLARRLRGTPRQ